MKRVVLATLMLLVLTTSLAAQRIAEKVNGDATLSSAFARGLMYLTDQDARPESSSSSVAHLWDNGRNVVDELANVMKVRAAALRRFGENNIREGAPLLTTDENQRAFVSYSFDQIKRFQEDPKKMNLTAPQQPPDGQPIGADDW